MAIKLDHDDLNRLLDKIAKSDIQEFSLEGEDFKLEIKRNLPNAINDNPVIPPSSQERQLPTSSSAINENTTPPPPTPPTLAVPPPARSDLIDITSPMVGTFYRASAPGEPPFVEVGSSISVGQTICILEAMKLMNEIESELSGEIVEIIVENGTPVEFGQVLMRVKKS